MILAKNKRAHFDYEILETFKAGMVLSGAEVKSAKLGHVQLKGSYASIDQGEVWLKNAFIAPYAPAKGTQDDYDPYHSRKLLLTKQEINRLIGTSKERGTTLIPIKMVNSNGLVKLELGIGKGKRKADKRETIKKRDFERSKSRLMKNS